MEKVIDDEELLLGLKQLNIERAVGILYDRFFEGIVTQICVKGGNRDDGSDIFQEAILVLIDKVKTGKFRGDSSIKVFLSAIAHNRWLHELRTRNRRNKREVAFVNLGDKNEEPVYSYWNDSMMDELPNIFKNIGETCKKILIGFYYEDKSMKELLSDFNYENEQVLRNRKSKCMKKLKELIATNKNLLETLKSISLYER